MDRGCHYWGIAIAVPWGWRQDLHGIYGNLISYRTIRTADDPIGLYAYPLCVAIGVLPAH